MKRNRNKTMNRRLASIIVASILPLSIMLLYMLWALINATNAYSDINRNVTYANEYVRNFKEKIDYTAYLAVIGNKGFDELDVGKTTVNGIVTVNPYSYIYELKSVCDDLAVTTTVKGNKNVIVNTKKSIKSLYNCIENLEKSIEGNGTYDKNMLILNNDIYTLTDVIEKGLQEYVYVETTNLAHVKTNLDKKNSQLIIICIVTLTLAIVLAIMLATRAAKSVSLPIKKLCSLTSKIAEGDFTVKSKVEAIDEIAVLNRNFNDMTTEIGKLVSDIKKQQKNLRKIEVKLLQAQINPHFLYNTLDTIVWLAEAGKNEQVVSMVTYLSDFFRTTLSGGKDIISVLDERRHIESYLKIQKLRYMDIMDFEIDFSEDILEYSIPKLTLQPLVENALVHGIRKKRGKGKVTITGVKQGEDIVFCVQDDGKGMNVEELDKLRKCIKNNNNNATDNGGFGIVNVNQRIHSYYGEKYGVYFESEENRGTMAKIVVGTKIIETLS